MKDIRIRLTDGREKRDSAEISLVGKLDADSSHQLKEALDWVLVEPVQTVILDLSDITFISREGIALLMKTKRKLAKRNVRLLLTKLQPKISKILKIFNELPRTPLFRSKQEMDDYLAVMQLRRDEN